MKDVVVIGGGAGGVPAAIRAAQLGADVLIIEEQGLWRSLHEQGLRTFRPYDDCIRTPWHDFFGKKTWALL